MKMPRIQKELTACLQCGYCINVCEAHNQTPWESDTPRGKIYYLNQLSQADGLDKLLKREVSLSPYFVDAMYKCTGCGNCEVVCHAQIPLIELWESVRTWLVKEGVGPMKAHAGMAKKVEECHNPYGEPDTKRGDWWPSDVPKSDVPDVIFFAGCTGSYRQQGIPQNGARILARAGVKMNILGKDEWCCTSPLLRTGNTGFSLDSAEKIVEKADGMGAKDMVMTCSGCFKTVSTDFGKYYAKVGQNVYHFSQYTEMLINEKKLPLNNEFKAKVTYHDPCHLGRHMGVFESPRNVLKKIKGIELIEMEKSKENSRCCGAGGGYKSQYNDFAVNIAAERIRDAEETGAEILVTCCPFCVVNLSQGAAKIKSKIKVMDLSDILLQVTAPKVEEPKKDNCPPTTSAPVVNTNQVDTPQAKPHIAAPSEKPKIEAAETLKAVDSPQAKPHIAAPVEKLKIEAVDPLKTSEPTARKTVIKESADSMDDDEEMGDDLDKFTDNSPSALVRRAAWNKGLRCRKDYGEYTIPIAFVKSKVGVFILDEGKVDPKIQSALEADDWLVLNFKTKDVTNGEDQAAVIRTAVKDNLKILRKKKK